MSGRVRRVGWASALAVTSILTACGSGGTERTADAPAAGLHAGHSASARAGDEVRMSLVAYKPEQLGVAVGTEVTWTQQDTAFHTVTSGTVRVDPSGTVETDPDGTFESGRLAKGEVFAFTFEESGTYAYFCEIHPSTMRGRITAA